MVGLADENIIADGFVLGARRILEDDEFFDVASKKLYKAVTGHARDGASQWVGSKLLALLGSALFAAGLYLVIRFGAGK
jgi:hypothetical protein